MAPLEASPYRSPDELAAETLFEAQLSRVARDRDGRRRPLRRPRVREGTRVPLLSFAQLRTGGAASAGEVALQPTSFIVTSDTALDGAVVAVLMTTEASISASTYDGWIVVFDRSATPMCHAHVVVKGATSFADLENRVHGAERGAARRLSDDLTLDF